MKEPLAPALGALMVAWVLFDVGDHSGIENTRAIRPGVTTWKVIREIWGAQKVLFFEINRLWKRP